MHFSHPDQRFSAGVILPPWGHLATPGHMFVVISRGVKAQRPALSGQRPGMRLHFLQGGPQQRAVWPQSQWHCRGAPALDPSLSIHSPQRPREGTSKLADPVTSANNQVTGEGPVLGQRVSPLHPKGAMSAPCPHHPQGSVSWYLR